MAKWQQVEHEGVVPVRQYRSDRLKVAGGWILRTITAHGSDAGACVVQTFIPDEQHKMDPAHT